MTPPPRDSRLADHRTEQVIGRLLQVGVLLAAAVTLAGGVLYLQRHGATVADYRAFNGAAASLRSLTGILHGVMAGQRAAIVQLGLVLLILTPIARVALTLGAFVIQKDRLYVLLTTVVLAVLVYGLFWARG